ncbi:MAG: hypothetical protein K2Z81_00220 [Cyanobacteria bacterium]|nr:hypothetical protein [Cyanobacteriota bacterium]
MATENNNDYLLEQTPVTTTLSNDTTAFHQELISLRGPTGSDDDDPNRDNNDNPEDSVETAEGSTDSTRAFAQEFQTELLTGNVRYDVNADDTYTNNDDGFGIVDGPAPERENRENQRAAVAAEVQAQAAAETPDSSDENPESDGFFTRAWNALSNTVNSINENYVEPALEYVGDMLNFDDWFSGENVDFGEAEEDHEGQGLLGDQEEDQDQQVYEQVGDAWDELIGDYGENTSRHPQIGQQRQVKGADGQVQTLTALSSYNEASGYQMFEDANTHERVLMAGNDQVKMREVGGQGSGIWEGTMENGRTARVDQNNPGRIEILDEQGKLMERVDGGNYSRFVDTGDGQREISVRSGQPTREQIDQLGNGNYEFRYQGADGKPAVTTVTRAGDRTVTMTLQEGESPRMTVQDGGRTFAFDGDTWAALDSNGTASPLTDDQVRENNLNEIAKGVLVDNMIVNVVEEQGEDGTTHRRARTDVYNNREDAQREMERRQRPPEQSEVETPEPPPNPLITVTSANPGDSPESQTTTIQDNERGERVEVTNTGATVFDQTGDRTGIPKYNLGRQDGTVTEMDENGNPTSRINSEGFDDLVNGMFMDLDGSCYGDGFFEDECFYDGLTAAEQAQEAAIVDAVSDKVQGALAASVSMVHGGNIESALALAYTGYSQVAGLHCASALHQMEVALMVSHASSILGQVQHGYATAKSAAASGAFTGAGYDRTALIQNATFGSGLFANPTELAQRFARNRGLIHDRDQTGATV